MNDELVNKGWQQMELLLDERMPVNPKRRYGAYYWLAGAAILLAAIAAVYFFTKSSNTPIASIQNQENNTTQIDSDKIRASTTDVTAVSSPSNEDLEYTAPTTSTSTSTSNSTSNSNKAFATPNSTGSINNKRSEKISQSTNDNQPLANTLNSHAATSKSTLGSSQNASRSDGYINNSIKSSSSSSSSAFSADQNPSTSGQSIIFNRQLDLDENKNELATTIRRNLINPDVFSNAIERLDLLALHPINYLSNLNLSFNTLSIQPKATSKVSSSRWEAYVDGLVGGEIRGAGLGINLVHRISPKLSLATGIEFAHYKLNEFERQTSASLPTDEIFQNASSYSSYLAENSINSSDFISSTTSIFAPINLRYSLCDKMDLIVGIRPGIQVHQALSYAPIAHQNNNRNPEIDNGKLTAEDFFYQKSVVTVQSSLGINYHISPRFSIGGFYRISLSDYGRSVQYSSLDRLEQIGANEVDRRFYSIESKKISPNLYGLRVTYRF